MIVLDRIVLIRHFLLYQFIVGYIFSWSTPPRWGSKGVRYSRKRRFSERVRGKGGKNDLNTRAD
jgi:hypothetical protein